MGNVGIILVDVNPFLDDGLIVGMQGKAAGVERTGASQAARLHFENIVAAIPVGIDPLAHGIAEESRYDFDRPGAPVREDAAVVVDVVDQNVGRLRRHDEFDLAIAVGDARHPRREAPISLGGALSACGLLLGVGLEDGLILRRQRRLLSATGRLADVKSARAADRAPPAAEIRILRVVPGPRVAACDAQSPQDRCCGDQASIEVARAAPDGNTV